MAVRRAKREASASRVAKWPKRKYRFQQKYQKIGPFNNGGRGFKTDPRIDSLINIRDTPLITKDKLIQRSWQVFLFWDDLTLWDSLCKDMTGIKGLLFYCIH